MAIGSFDNPITGVDGALTVNQIKSPNFDIVAQTGWCIMKNGDAFFYNITAAGSVTANTVIIKGSGDGVFIYDGLPGPGTLVLAMASAPGTDHWGNDYPGPGMSLSAPGSGTKNNIQLRPDLGALLVYT